MTYHQQLMEKYQIRKSRAQKDAFLAWAKENCEKLGYTCREDVHGKKRNTVNLVAGDPEKARVIYTAHYDTPARSPMPNKVFPQNFFFTLLVQMPLVLMILAPALGVGLLLEHLTGDPRMYALGFLPVYFGLFLLVMRGAANPHTANDNSSGTAALFQVMEMLPAEMRDQAAFIFFDNEEKGKVGSKAFAKSHPEIKEKGLIFNMDCIGDGKHILVLAPKNAEEQLLRQLNAAYKSEGDFQAVQCSAKEASYNSDQKSFKRGVAVGAFHKGRMGYFLSRIHTSRDVICEQANLDYVCKGAVEFIKQQ